MKIIRQVNGPWGLMPSCGLSTSLNHYSSCYRKLFLIFGSVRPSYHFFLMPHLAWVPGGSSSKEPTCQCRRLRFHPWVGKISWRRAWQPTPVFLPGEPPWTEEPGGLQSMGRQRVCHDRVTKHNLVCSQCLITYGNLGNSQTTTNQKISENSPW